MPPIIMTILQGLFLLLLYVFVGRAVRAVVRDLRTGRPVQGTPRPSGGSSRGGSRSKARRAPASQLVVHMKEGRPRVIDLNGRAIVFGRAPTATVMLDDPYVSDEHARVYREGGEWLIADLRSTNGTFLNQVKVSAPTPIAAGDQLGIGRTVVEVRR